jgi:uncharacterized protein (TIGR03435 family)
MSRLAALLALAALPAQSQSPPPAFEAASVKQTPRASLGFTNISPYGTDRFTATNAELYLLVQIAFNVTPDRISGIEKLGDGHYDISAKAKGDLKLTYEEVQPRLQRLLAERFKLATHRETKEMDGYVLVVATGGPKLKASAGVAQQGVIYPGGLRFPHIGMDGFAAMLATPVGRPVIDKTGVAGMYQIELKYAPDSSLPSLLTALDEQLGLKLEPQKVPVEMLVIDRVEKIPTEN